MQSSRGVLTFSEVDSTFLRMKPRVELPLGLRCYIVYNADSDLVLDQRYKGTALDVVSLKDLSAMKVKTLTCWLSFP